MKAIRNDQTSDASRYARDDSARARRDEARPGRVVHTPRLTPDAPLARIEPRPAQLERRSSARTRIRGGFMAAISDPEGDLFLTTAELVDASDGGLGLLCPVEIEPGSRVSLYSPRDRRPADGGTVVRCSTDGESFRIGLKRETRLAA